MTNKNTVLLKYCSSCKTDVEVTKFHKDSSNSSGLAYHCKDCANERSRIWNSKRENTDKRNKRVNERVRIRKTKLVEEFGGCCADCNGVFKLCCYDFHHKNSDEKDFNIGDLLKLSTERLNKEKEKCIMLCANCHRVRHYG